MGLYYGQPFLQFFFPDQGLTAMVAVFNVLFLIAIPLISIILFVARLLFGTFVNNYWKIGLGVFWWLNLTCLVIIGGRTAKSFNAADDVEMGIVPLHSTSDTLRLLQGENKYNNTWLSLGDEVWVCEQGLVVDEVRLKIERAKGKEFELLQTNSSRGSSVEEARNFAKNAKWNYTLNGNELVLDPFYMIEKGKQWRGQHIQLTLRIPEGKSIFISEELYHMIDDMEKSDEAPSLWDYPNQVWTMRADGLYTEEPQGEESKEFRDFEQLTISGKIKTIVERGDEFSIRLAGAQSYLDDVTIDQDETQLTVSSELEETSSPITLYITMPRVSVIHADQTNDIKIVGFKQPNLEVSGNGRFEIKLDVEVESLSVNLESDCKMDLTGQIKQLQAQLEDHAFLDAQKATLSEAEILAEGYSKAKVATNVQLRQTIDGTSEVSAN